MGGQSSDQGDSAHDWSSKYQEIMDVMQTRSFCGFRTSGAWQPTINVYERRDAYFICVDVAGLDRSSLSIRCTDARRVVLAGQRARPQHPNTADPFTVELMEIDEGPFQREIELSVEVDGDGVELLYKSGYLWITLRKRTSHE
jgi:HSP20 family molecular chaperone IbpA